MLGHLIRHFQKINARYHGAEGDAFALEELAPVAARHLPQGGRVLEIGCGYGRNLVALASLPGAHVVGSDPALAELARANSERLAPLPAGQRERVGLVQQEDLRLPFRDDAFDLVVLWQVLEHVFEPHRKQGVLDEALRVTRDGGHVLVETPNGLFPVDYHDNGMPLAHWLLPRGGREWLTWKVRGKRYHPSEYLNLPSLERHLQRAARGRGVRKATRVYFARSYAEAFANLGGSQVGLKRVLFAVVAPVHALLRLFGGSADLVLPSLRVVYQVGGSGVSTPRARQPAEPASR
jgi:SAM-dependent methyltransferase